MKFGDFNVDFDKYDKHIPVMLREVFYGLNIFDHIDNNLADRYFLDCTFGDGGYSEAILDYNDRFYLDAIDLDPEVCSRASIFAEKFGKRFCFRSGNFRDASSLFPGKKYDGIVLDLGVSSMQIDNHERGFSFMRDGYLDMRMDNKTDQYLDAYYFINHEKVDFIADVIYQYSDETYSRVIARAIEKARLIKPITTTFELADIVREAKGRYQKKSRYGKYKIDPVTKTFQAIRIYINKELESLEMFLSNIFDILKYGGRLVIVSFHSLEDKIVKDFVKSHSLKKNATSKYKEEQFTISKDYWLKILTKKPITPSKDEVEKNIRSRSAKMRVIEKIYK